MYDKLDSKIMHLKKILLNFDLYKMSTKTDKDIRKAKTMVNEMRDYQGVITRYSKKFEEKYNEIRMINEKINKIHKKNNVHPGDSISKEKMKKIYEEMSAEELRKIYEKQKNDLSDTDKKIYEYLINRKQERV